MSLISHFYFLGKRSYEKIFQLQKNLAYIKSKLSPESCPHSILFLEHTPVFTFGIREKISDYVSILPNFKLLKADVVKSDRGGMITYHGPGQLTIYPICNLLNKNMKGKGISWFAKSLENVGYNFLKNEFSLVKLLKGSEKSGNVGETGVWADENRKLMAIGLHKTHNITYHGIGLNLTSEPLDYFSHIIPCGLIGKQVTSISEVVDPSFAGKINPMECSAKLIPYFEELFSFSQSVDKNIIDCQHLNMKDLTEFLISHHINEKNILNE